MPTTPFKGYEVQVSGTNAGTWGDVLNDDMISPVDTNMGGIVVKAPAGSNITLTPDEAKCALIRLTGTGPSAAIQVLSSNQGFYFVENLCTGSFPITITNGVAGIVVPNGLRVTIFADTTNGCRIFGNLGFVTGTSQTFFNATAPTGWTKSTSVDNGTIRLVSSSGGGTGGTANFTSAFAARTITQANLPNYNLPVSDPGHVHPYTRYNALPNVGSGASVGPTWAQVTTVNTGGAFTGISVNSGGSGTAMDFAVKYIDAIRAVVN